MLSRRLVLAAALALAAPTVAQANWRQQLPELTFAVVPSENAGGVMNRYEGFVQFLSRELGVPVRLRIANDYAAVIEGLRTRQVHFAHLGPSAYVRAWTVTNGDTLPLVVGVNSEGGLGYFSVLYVRANTPFQSIQDLRGRPLCLVDPNSASGNNVPRFAMSKMGIEPETFFSRVVYAGSHENAVTALASGTCDAAFNWWNTERESNLLRMAAKNMVNPADFRIVFRSDLIPSSPITTLRSYPEDFRRDLLAAFEAAPVRGREAWLRISDGQATGYQRVTHDMYQVMIDLQAFVDAMRRQRRGT